MIAIFFLFFDECKVKLKDFSLTPYLESCSSSYGLGTPVFSENFFKFKLWGSYFFSKRCFWDSYFQNPSYCIKFKILAGSADPDPEGAI